MNPGATGRTCAGECQRRLADEKAGRGQLPRQAPCANVNPAFCRARNFHCTRAGRLRLPGSLPGPAPRAADRPAPCPPPPEKAPAAVQRRPARPRRACTPPDPGSGPRHPQIPQPMLRSVQLKWRRSICCAWCCRFLLGRAMASHRSWSDHWFEPSTKTGGRTSRHAVASALNAPQSRPATGC